MAALLAGLSAWVPLPAAAQQGAGSSRAAASPTPVKVIHVFVALCDNASQGIAPVPAKIGNGDDPDANLYWGCSDGLPSVFGKSKAWKKLGAAVDPDGDGPILKRVIFQHRETGAVLVGDAWQGRQIKACLTGYFAALSGHGITKVQAGDREVEVGGAAGLVAYIGHNGLMEFNVDVPLPTADAKARPRSTIALCCISQRYFKPFLGTTGARPLILTRQLMYPAAQILREGVEGWLAGADAATCTARGAAAYAANQKISRKAAAGVLASGF